MSAVCVCGGVGRYYVGSRGEGGRSQLSGGRWRIPYHVTYPKMHVMYLTPPREQTDACENITFPQLRLWTEIIFIPKLIL